MSAINASSAQECWDRLLEARHLNGEDIAALEQWQREAGLVFGEQPCARTLRPLLLEPEQLERDQAMARAVVTALVHASQYLERDPVLARRYLGDWVDQFGDLLTLDPGYPQRAVLARLDVLPTQDGPKVIEFNPTPGGILQGDQLTELFQRLADQIGFDREWRIRPLLVFPPVRESLVNTYRAWGGQGDPLLVFAVPRELKDLVDPIQATIDALAQSGLSARIADPGELEFTDGALRHRGEPVGVLVRVFLPKMIQMIPGLGERLQGIYAAVRAGAVCLVTAFRNTLLGHKALFALISDPEIDLGLPEEVAELVRAHVPWTRLLIDGSSRDPAGQPIDLLPWAIAQRQQLVCKPVSGYGGSDVVLGWTLEETAWREHLEKAARRGGSLLQQRVTLVPRTYPSLAEGLPSAELYADQNIYIADGELVGYLTRLATTPITNVSQGASIVPCFLVTRRG
ncbi:hypothetical protein [Thiocystis violacea]|uniref:hypothetical protein n=1 Tax=Thiocystis violacea TaxID=13725 RepID=UPI00190554B9|nr:hypothetical protein [Thiocystis violacea]MBK1720259.1 hypothetical protein [Thiocystis violacea]